MIDRNTILKHLKHEASRLGQTLSNLQSSGNMNSQKEGLAEITTLLKDIQQIIHAIENAQETDENP